jgi:hypothetical protein
MKNTILAYNIIHILMEIHEYFFNSNFKRRNDQIRNNLKNNNNIYYYYYYYYYEANIRKIYHFH